MEILPENNPNPKRHITPREFLHGASTVGESTRVVVDLRADEAGWAGNLVFSDQISQWPFGGIKFDEGTTRNATNIDMRTIDGIVPIPRRASTGGT